MFALVILYFLVFYYIRVQLREFTAAMSTTRMDSSNNFDLDRWQVDLEVNGPNRPPATYSHDPIMNGKVVSVIVEDRHRAPSPLPIGSQHSQSLRPSTSRREGYNTARKRMLNVARSLLWYPLVYLCLTMPITIGRLA